MYILLYRFEIYLTLSFISGTVSLLETVNRLYWKIINYNQQRLYRYQIQLLLNIFSPNRNKFSYINPSLIHIIYYSFNTIYSDLRNQYNKKYFFIRMCLINDGEKGCDSRKHNQYIIVTVIALTWNTLLSYYFNHYQYLKYVRLTTCVQFVL